MYVCMCVCMYAYMCRLDKLMSKQEWLALDMSEKDEVCIVSRKLCNKSSYDYFLTTHPHDAIFQSIYILI